MTTIFPGPAITTDPVMASLAGLVIGAQDEFGTTITLEEEEGWYGSTTFRHPGRAARPQAHGHFSSAGFSDGRPITLGGKAFALDSAAAIRTMRRMRATLADGSSGPLSMFDPESTVLTATVELDGPWRVRWLSDRVFEWQVNLFAPDPRVYGEDQFLTTSLPGGGGALVFPIGAVFDFGDPGSSGSVTVTNTGTAASEPAFSAQGPLAVGFQVTYAETGQRLRYEGTVADPVLIDCASGLVTSGGQDRLGLLTVDEFFSVPAGESATFQFATLGSETSDGPALMTARFAPAYA